ncbi:hypothetical protein C2I18_00860 [Paenibacillus sp. PK3_47]|uniref:hypothetical protein n=1 Tax=Paenibacillus sp. PK3_47 TaxID=2072642 RepID=UPI00201D37AB|nr:hypothetical protein [Paenibacillus sp. PK3_47]UQZ32221.1 hypothetical protein C2I18_00860 [Paenibacillus sp. PK3_47]
MNINEIMKPGITGFSASRDDFGQQDIKPFEAWVYPLVSTLGAEIVHKELSLVRKSFYTYQVSSSLGGPFSVLLHSVYPFVAFAAVADYAGIEFIDINLGTADHTFFSYKILPQMLLDTPLTSADTVSLRDYEQRMLRYWKPATIGEVIFNYWD